MKEKTIWESCFDNTEDIQCITCFDAYVLEYYIKDCRIRVERNNNNFAICIISYDENGERLDKNDFDKAWREKNIYNQAIYQKFINGYFFHE